MKRFPKTMAVMSMMAVILTGCSQGEVKGAMESKDAMSMEQTGDMMSKDSMKEDSMEDKKMEKSEEMNDGEMAPDFSLKDAAGNAYTLSEQGGKKVYVKFWASWCSICLAGLEELNTLAGEDNDFEIVTVVAPGKNGEKSKEEFSKWFETLGYSNIKVLFDETGETIDNYRVRAYPTSAMVGTDGVLVSLAPGHLPSDQIKKAFEQVK